MKKSKNSKLSIKSKALLKQIDKLLKRPSINDLVHVSYDYDTDVLYITLGTHEQSYSEETDDTVLIERGFTSELPTGFRVLNFRKNWLVSRTIANNQAKKSR